MLQLDEQVQHLRLDRDVEGGDGLVGDDELRLQHERAREPDPLALAAAEHVRVAVGRLLAEPDALEHVDHDVLAILLVQAVDAQALADEAAHGHARVERADGVLEDDLHVAPHRLQVAAAEAAQVDAVELDLARRGLEQAQQRAAERGLAAAGLAHEPHGLAAEDVEVDAVDRLQLPDGALEDALLHREVLLHRAGLEQGLRGRVVRNQLRLVALLGAHATTWRTRGSRRPCSQSQHADSCGGTGRSGGSFVTHFSKA